MIILFQLLFSLFAVLAGVSVWNKKNAGLLGKKSSFFWLLFWSLFAIMVWLPDSLTAVANILGVARGADLVFYGSLAIIFYLLFRFNLKIELINRDITKIVRKNALEKED